jgi:hypothetical protein
MKKTKSNNRPSIYQTVTERIISSLKAGVIPWEKPWKAHVSPVADSRATSIRASPTGVSMSSCFGRVTTAALLAHLQTGAGIEGTRSQGRVRNADCLLQTTPRRQEDRREQGRGRTRPVSSLPLHRIQRGAVRRPHVAGDRPAHHSAGDR